MRTVQACGREKPGPLWPDRTSSARGASPRAKIFAPGWNSPVTGRHSSFCSAPFGPRGHSSQRAPHCFGSLLIRNKASIRPPTCLPAGSLGGQDTPLVYSTQLTMPCAALAGGGSDTPACGTGAPFGATGAVVAGWVFTAPFIASNCFLFSHLPISLYEPCTPF